MMVRTDTEDLPVLDRGILRESPSAKCAACRILLWVMIFTVIAVAILSSYGCAPRAAPSMPATPPPCNEVDPLKAWLVYGVLVGIVGVGAGVAMFIWLPFKKTAIAIVGGAGAIIGTSLLVRSILPYMEWIVLGSATVAIGALLWHNRRLFVASREMWKHVPDDAPVLASVEKLMNKIG